MVYTDMDYKNTSVQTFTTKTMVKRGMHYMHYMHYIAESCTTTKNAVYGDMLYKDPSLQSGTKKHAEKNPALKRIP